MPLQLQDRPYTAWQLIKSYWQSEQKTFAYIFLITTLTMTVILVGLEAALSYWYKYFYDALQAYNKGEVYDLIAIFFFIAGLYIVMAVYRYYIQSYLGLRWRKWLTDQFLDRWLAKRSYYYLETFEKATDNPDQRIQEDINVLISNSLSLLVGFLSSIVTIPAFIYILWTLSGILKIPLGHFGTLNIPGYLAWVGVFYAIGGTYFTFKIGRPLIMLNFEQQRKEADFRFAAVDLRKYSENVALYRGEKHQKNILSRLLDRLLANWYMIILRQKLLLWFTAGYNQFSVILPLAVALPNYFNKVFELGGLMQALRAFSTVQDSLSFFVNAYPQIAEWRAVNKRLITFLNHMYEIEKSTTEQDDFVIRYHGDNNIVVKNINIKTPNNTNLLENINQEFMYGKNYVIKGISGIGKSTFVRAVAGIWPYGSGEIMLPGNLKIMYLPQKSYMPLGTLKEALLFPDNIDSVPDQRLRELLAECGLSELSHRLHDTEMWSLQLSPGEQQRIAFVRVIIQKPDWVFLDEATAALDVENEKRMYQWLRKELPNCSIISVGHRPTLDAYHDQAIDFSQYGVERVVA